MSSEDGWMSHDEAREWATAHGGGAFSICPVCAQQLPNVGPSMLLEARLRQHCESHSAEEYLGKINAVRSEVVRLQAELAQAQESIEVRSRLGRTLHAELERVKARAVAAEQAQRTARAGTAELFDELADDLIRRRDALGMATMPRISGKRMAYEHAAELVRAAAARLPETPEPTDQRA